MDNVYASATPDPTGFSMGQSALGFFVGGLLGVFAGVVVSFVGTILFFFVLGLAVAP